MASPKDEWRIACESTTRCIINGQRVLEASSQEALVSVLVEVLRRSNVMDVQVQAPTGEVHVISRETLEFLRADRPAFTTLEELDAGPSQDVSEPLTKETT